LFGLVVKVNVVYDELFWCIDGFNGYMVSDVGLIKIIYDNLLLEGSFGVLVGFMEGNDGCVFYGDYRVRRAVVLECFVCYYGEWVCELWCYVDIVWLVE